jgi:RNA polymerase sigma-70 factor, ECF subfamily
MMLPGPANTLVSALVEGQRQAFAALYDCMGAPMLRVAEAMLRSRPDAEDLVQDVFVELVRHRDRLRQVRDLEAYLFAMLRHAAGRKLQRSQNERRHLLRWVPATAGSADMTVSDQLTAALFCLPAEQREIIALKIDAALTFAQIGEILNVSQNTAASRYRYAIQKLRAQIEDP